MTTMSIPKLIKLCGATLLSGMLAGVSLTAQAAEENLYPGTACMTTNTATGANFHWNIQGLQNNSSVDRFVICPFVIDQNQWDASPSLFVEATIFMPPGYGAIGAQGPTCFARFMQTNGNISNAGQTIISNVSFTVSFFDGNAATGDEDSAGVNINATNSLGGNGHLLCVVPRNGGQIRHYRVLQQ